MADWKDSLNLPRTEFPMKAKVSQKIDGAVAAIMTMHGACAGGETEHRFEAEFV